MAAVRDEPRGGGGEDPEAPGGASAGAEWFGVVEATPSLCKKCVKSQTNPEHQLRLPGIPLQEGIQLPKQTNPTNQLSATWHWEPLGASLGNEA